MPMAIYKEIIDGQLYVYMNGKLTYKRWLKTGQSLVFDIMPYDKHTLKSIKMDYLLDTFIQFLNRAVLHKGISDEVATKLADDLTKQWELHHEKIFGSVIFRWEPDIQRFEFESLNGM